MCPARTLSTYYNVNNPQNYRFGKLVPKIGFASLNRPSETVRFGRYDLVPKWVGPKALEQCILGGGSQWLQCLPAGDDRDIDLYHWSSERFSAAWKTTISVLVAKGRARVGVAASVADWPKRIRDLQFLDHEGFAAAT